MLKDHFFYITSITHQDNTFVATLQLNNDHDIFKGHFPEQPVVSGACMLQMVKEVLADALQAAYQLKKADHLKFIAPIDPRVTDDVELKIAHKNTDAGLQVIAGLSANGVVCFKFQGVWVVS